MSQFDDKMNDYLGSAKELGVKVNQDLLTKVAKGLGPSIYNNDSAMVSSSDKEELNHVKENFLKKKLGLTDDAAMDAAIEKVVNIFGSSNRSKYRALFYYLLVVEFGKESVYNG